jgi:YesN/AraC family two-component response regulator
MEMSAAISDADPVESVAPRPQPRLLVVDCQHAFIGLARLVAQRLGFEVSVLKDSRRVESNFVKHQPDVLILEVVMPELDGIEVINILAHQRYNGHLILVSGHGPSCLELAKKTAEARNLKVIAALPKPIRQAAMEKILKEISALRHHSVSSERAVRPK